MGNKVISASALYSTAFTKHLSALCSDLEAEMTLIFKSEISSRSQGKHKDEQDFISTLKSLPTMCKIKAKDIKEYYSM